MSENADNLTKTLAQFDLSEDEVRLYLFILKANSTTALKASREMKIARTKIYRLLEKLISKGLVFEQVKEYGSKFTAAEPDKFLQLLNEREKDLLLLKSSTPMLVNQLNALKPLLDPSSKIVHYRGIEGLKQITWNSTKVVGDFRIYEIDLMNAFLSKDFSEKCREEFARKPKNRFMQLTNKRKFEEYTSVEGHVKQWEVRYIPESKLRIDFEIQIYNDVYCMLDYTEDDIFIVEIYNKKLADIQKQIFDIVWSTAKPFKKLGNRGEAVLK